uniref:Odorant receptor n=1 Tax=Musca domestica TaxID=7370 RepID=A0A1I8M7E2_MUSDO
MNNHAIDYLELWMANNWVSMGFCVFLTFIKEQENLRFLLTECYDIYEKYERMDSDYRVYLDRGVRLLAKLMKLSAFINAMLVFGMSSFTFLYNFIYGTKATIVYAFAPGLDVATPVGFWATNFIQAGFIAVGGFGLYSGDMSVLTPISQIPTFQGILQCKFREINQLLDDDYESAEERGIKTMAALKDILEFHQKYLIFLKVSREASYWSVFAKVGTCIIGIVGALFCIMLGSWPAGYIYMLYCFVMMQVFCVMGTLVQKTNDDFIHACYNDVRWYDLTIREKKMLNIMLIMTQNTKGLSVGSVIPLSMNTGLQVTKTIYSLTMLLMNFVIENEA